MKDKRALGVPKAVPDSLEFPGQHDNKPAAHPAFGCLVERGGTLGKVDPPVLPCCIIKDAACQVCAVVVMDVVSVDHIQSFVRGGEDVPREVSSNFGEEVV